MVNQTLRHTIICLSLLSLILSGGGRPQKAVGGESTHTPRVKAETREYIAKNGRDIAITSLGTIIGLRGPNKPEADTAPIRDGYRLTYKRAGDGKLLRASALSEGGKDAASDSGSFVPVSFEAPPTGSVIPEGGTLMAKVTVRTSDGLLRLTHLLVWKPGSDSLNVQTEIANSDAKGGASVIAFERTIGVKGQWAALGNQKPTYRKVLELDPSQNTLYIDWLDLRCLPPNCPPPPPLRLYGVKADSASVIRLRGSGPSEFAKGKAEAYTSPPGGQLGYEASLMWEFKLDAGGRAAMKVTIQYSQVGTKTP